MISKLDFRLLENAKPAGTYGLTKREKLTSAHGVQSAVSLERGYGTIGNERRFYLERNRSCYLRVVQSLLKRNPSVKCAKCGEMEREHHGKDGTH